MNSSQIAAIKSARKRAISMGKVSEWQPEYSSCALAACLHNHITALECELAKPQPDYLAVLCWIGNMAARVNAHCDAYRVVGDSAAQYWLDQFRQHCDVVCDWSKLQ